MNQIIQLSQRKASLRKFFKNIRTNVHWGGGGGTKERFLLGPNFWR